MRFIINNLNEFINFLILYHQKLIEDYSKDSSENNIIRTKILIDLYIKNRKEIIEKEFAVHNEEYMFVKCFFENPYHIFIKNDKEDSVEIIWEENIFDISIEKLSELMKKHNKKYLTIWNGFQGWIGKRNIVEMELD